MSDRELWRVYGAQPMPRTFASKRDARRLQRKYARLGIKSTLYSGSGDDWDKHPVLPVTGETDTLTVTPPSGPDGTWTVTGEQG